jgi:nitroimidazol reductase NimA-like FMN-containing flavoprotein (pyridoxamine 5'-phosphate oxidase superfamily)
MATNYAEIALGVLRSISYGTLATVSANGEPWNCPVIMVYDDDLNLYWFSDRMSQHGRNVRRNPAVFIVMYDSTVPKFGLDHGLYVQAQAHEVSDPKTIALAKGQLWGQHKAGAETYSGDSPRRVYQAVAERIWVNDVEFTDGRKFVRDYRVEVPVPELMALIRRKPQSD